MRHLAYPAWEKSIEHQAHMLDSIIRDTWGDTVSAILQVACGIGAQSPGLAGLGCEPAASDISAGEIERAGSEGYPEEPRTATNRMSPMMQSDAP